MDNLFAKAMKQRYRKILEDLLVDLENARDDPNWKSKTLGTIRDMIEEMEQPSGGRPWDFSEQKKLSFLVSDGEVTLRPITDKDQDFFIGVRKEYSDYYKDLDPMVAREVYVNEACRDLRFYCVIEAGNCPVGYIGIIDSSKNLWELVLELKKDQCHMGYGTRANILFIRKIAEITGKTQYKSVVEVDNLASQACMAKLNAELVDIENRAFKSEEEAEQFEEEHLDLINDHMIRLASELDVEPRQLLSHVLDYRIYADRLPDIARI